MEKPISFLSTGFEIEGLLEIFPGMRGVVVTHPHPLYGGEMRNAVVEAMRRAYAESGFSTLRFNFRGVGKSQGRHNQGFGEQDDMRAAVAYLRDMGIKLVHLCGYSFGAWVSARAVMSGLSIETMVMVSPPVAFMDFEGMTGIDALQWVLVGDRDEIAPISRIREMIPSWNPNAGLEIIPGADHFFSGQMKTLESTLQRCLEIYFPPSIL